MPLASLDPLVIVSSIALLLGVLSLWLGRRVWIAALLLAVAVAYGAGVMFGPAGVWIFLLAGAAWLYRNWKPRLSIYAVRLIRAALALVVVCLALSLGAHVLPGFNNPILLRDVLLSPDAPPYRQYVNFDKTIAGVLILGIAYQGLLRSRQDWFQSLRRAAPIIAVNVVVVVLFALAIGYVRFDPKWTTYFWTWAALNLFFTCVSEEALFRGFIQRELAAALHRLRFGATAPVLISATLFGLAHVGGGWTYVLLSSVAGLGYALTFRLTDRIEMSILAHFSLNAAHFLLLTYPRAV